MTMNTHRLFLPVVLAAVSLPAAANNIQVANVSITDQDSITKTANFVFDLSWENSWRLSNGPANWDAAWVFVKYHNGDNVWRHAKLDTVPSSHNVPAGAELSIGQTGGDGLGAFIHRSAAGSGNIAWSGIKLLWNYGADGILDTAVITAEVHAIEMVYVPEGAFHVGDGSTTGRFVRGSDGSQPFQITASGTLSIGNGAGQIGGREGVNYPAPPAGSIYPPEFPNGYGAFYCMKYEASVEQLQNALESGMPNPYGFWVSGADNQAVSDNNAPGYFTPIYLSWSGLRPMTIFEYEKACRGPVYPVGGEFAWGSAVVADQPYTLADVGLATESVASGYDVNKGNCTYSRTILNNQPTRVGIYAKPSYTGTTSPRIQSGSTYWGIMDMTGNVAEPLCEAYAATPSNQTAFNNDPANHIEVAGNYYAYPSNRFRGSHGDGSGTKPADWELTWVGFDYDYAPPNTFQFAVTPISRPADSQAQMVGSPLGIRGARSAP